MGAKGIDRTDLVISSRVVPGIAYGVLPSIVGDSKNSTIVFLVPGRIGKCVSMEE
jgi:hypothetical protein